MVDTVANASNQGSNDSTASNPANTPEPVGRNTPVSDLFELFLSAVPHFSLRRPTVPLRAQTMIVLSPRRNSLETIL